MRKDEGVQGGLVELQAGDGAGGNPGLPPRLESWGSGDELKAREWH